MSVTILTARAHRLFAPVVEALGQCARKGEDVLLLVPEQFTLAAERGGDGTPFAHRHVFD